MSRLPPQIKQQINGQPVPGWEVQPVTKDGVTYKIDSRHSLDDFGKIIGMDWTLEASDVDSKILWKTMYYHKEFIPNLETDVQESFPIDFKVDDEMFVIEHEHGTIFKVSFEGILL